MDNRDFSDSVKLSIITDNLRKNNGEICCVICGMKITSIDKCHFDHIFPFAKGGKSTVDNCQILCVNCNLKKSQKELADFMLEEKAKRFLAGDIVATQVQSSKEETEPGSVQLPTEVMSKEAFDQAIADFISRNGDIRKVDFGREYNHLPSIHYVNKYYGDLGSLKKAFNVEDLSANWNRDTIESALKKFVEENGGLTQNDLMKKNGLPSLPCIMRHYPEYNGFKDLKKNMLGLDVRKDWDKESVLQAGKEYVSIHGKITENCLNADNNLPTTRVVYSYFGTLAAYQQAVGSPVSFRNEFITEADIENAVNEYFGKNERKVVSMREFFQTFPYSPSTIHKRFGSFAVFCQKHNITVERTKKASYSKQEVDDAIIKWVKEGKKIPLGKDLRKLGLPSMSVILKYYEDWKEPFILYQKINDKMNP